MTEMRRSKTIKPIETLYTCTQICVLSVLSLLCVLSVLSLLCVLSVSSLCLLCHHSASVSLFCVSMCVLCLFSVSSLCPLCVLVMSSLCPRCVLVVPSLCPRYVLAVSLLCPRCVPSVSSLCPCCVLAVSLLCPRCVLVVSSLCPRYVLVMSSLCPLCVLVMSSLCPRCVLVMSSLCPLCVLVMSSLCPRCVLSVSSLCPLCVPSVSSLCPLCVLAVSPLCPRCVLSLCVLVVSSLCPLSLCPRCVLSLCVLAVSSLSVSSLCPLSLCPRCVLSLCVLAVSSLSVSSLCPLCVLAVSSLSPPGHEICYGELGCFSDASPWSGTFQRLLAAQPWTPEKINTQFFLLTRENLECHQFVQNISARDLPGLRASSFRTSRETIFIVHGMDDRAENNWVSDMCHELILLKDVNCIGVDWHRGSGNVLLYVQAANNGRVVAAEIAYFLKTLQGELDYPPSNVHIIGHSLGAHIAGDAGRRFPGIRRVTGLDPARPYFENAVEEVRLDPSDAGFVDVIHTDAEKMTGLGLAQPIGHFDFYPNGGKHMAGCPHKLLAILQIGKGILKASACDHFRAFLYYTHSIRSPGGFVSYPCDSYENFTSGSCFPCPPQGCPPMGYHSEDYYNITDQKKKFYLNTGGSPPHFSSWRYKVSLTLNKAAKTFDKLYISLYGAGGNVTKHQLGRGGRVSENTYSEFIDSPVMLHPLGHVTFYWTPTIFSINIIQLGASRMDIQSGEDGTISAFCGNGTVPDDVTQVLGPCADLDPH